MKTLQVVDLGGQHATSANSTFLLRNSYGTSYLSTAVITTNGTYGFQGVWSCLSADWALTGDGFSILPVVSWTRQMNSLCPRPHLRGWCCALDSAVLSWVSPLIIQPRAESSVYLSESNVNWERVWTKTAVTLLDQEEKEENTPRKRTHCAQSVGNTCKHGM